MSLSSACLLSSFRDGGCCQLSMTVDDQTTSWICADDLGKVLTLQINSQDHQNNTTHFDDNFASNSIITAIAISPCGTQVALAFADSLHLRKYPDVNDDIVLYDDANDSISMQMLCRRTLPITHIEYDSHGKM